MTPAPRPVVTSATILLALAALLAACGDSTTARRDAGADASAPDGPVQADAATPADAAPDAAPPAADAPAPDAPVADAAPAADAGGTDACPGVGPGASQGACDDCLDTACADALCACGDECVAIQACLQGQCRALSGTGEVGACQAACQNEHLAGKPAHLAVVSCAYGADCAGCTYPASYDGCRASQRVGACAAPRAACDASAACLAYEACVTSCGSLATCLACQSTAAGAAGKLLLEAFEVCVARECLTEYWAR